jgi:Cys-rich repeat protein
VVTNECVGCTSDLDCPVQHACDPDTNTCYFFCLEHTDCPPGQACIDNSCEEVDCITDAECLAGSVCVDNTCVPIPCVDDGDCPQGSECNQDLGVCQLEKLPGTDCLVTNDCDDSTGCASGYCLRCQGLGEDNCNGCASNADCGAGFPHCNVELNACLRCLTSDHCSGTQICHPYGECAAPCVTDANCSGQRVCDAYGRCVYPGQFGSECSVDADCFVGGSCVNGYCRACEEDLQNPGQCETCNAGVMCDSGNVCDYQAFVCVECRDDDDCGAGELCMLGECQPPCFNDAQCPGGLVCHLGLNRCVLP